MHWKYLRKDFTPLIPSVGRLSFEQIRVAALELTQSNAGAMTMDYQKTKVIFHRYWKCKIKILKTGQQTSRLQKCNTLKA